MQPQWPSDHARRAPRLSPGAVIKVGDVQTFVVIALNHRPLGDTYTLLFDDGGEFQRFEEFVSEIDRYERVDWVVDESGVTHLGHSALRAS